MTTEQGIDLLNLLSEKLNPVEAEQRDADFKAERERPMDRSPLQDFTATFRFPSDPFIILAKPSWNETHVVIELDDLEVTKTYSGRSNGDDTRITLRVPDGEFKPRADDESTYMLKSFMPFFPGVEAGAILTKLQGVRATVEEVHEPYTYWDKKAKVEVTKPRFYYKAIKVVGATNGRSAQKAEPKPASIAQALDLLISAGEDGIVEAEFNMQVSKLVKGDAPFLGYLADGKFAADQIAAGKVLRDGLKLVAV